MDKDNSVSQLIKMAVPILIGMSAVLGIRFYLITIDKIDKFTATCIAISIAVFIIIIAYLILHLHQTVKSHKEEKRGITCYSSLSGSGVDFLSLLDRAENEVFTVGQSLRSLVEAEIDMLKRGEALVASDSSSNKYRKEVFAKLLAKKAEGKDFKVKILFCNPDSEFTEGWKLVSNPNFKKDLQYVISVFQDWKKEAEIKDYQGLEIRLTPAVPLSLSYIDPDGKNTKLVVVPNALAETKHERPVFCLLLHRNISKDEYTALNYYINRQISVWKSAVSVMD